MNVVKKICVILALCIVGALLLRQLLARSAQPTTVTTHPSFTYACSANENQESILCLEKTYQEYTLQKGVAAAFVKLKAAYTADVAVKASCHLLAHTIGRTAADMLGTVDDAYAEGDNFCWSGYYHGVMESIVSKISISKLPAAIPTICAQIKQTKPYSFYHYNCVHGLGHGVMDVTNSQLFTSLHMCDLLQDAWEQQSCYGGVFMENEMDEVNPDHTTVYFKAGQPMYPCTAVDNKYKEQCYLMQTSHALRVANENFSLVFQECGSVDPAFIATCDQSLGRDASGNSNSTVGKTIATCMLGPNFEAQQNCFIGAVKDFISYYHSDKQANTLCEALSGSLQTTCQTTKVQYYSTF